MSKMSKVIATLGVVAGLGVAALPLSSYAADYSQSTNSQVKVEVGGAISISIEDANGTDGAALSETELTTAKNNKEIPYYENGTLDLGTIKVNGKVREGSIAVVVTSNEAETYDLTIRSLNDYNELRSEEGATIPATTGVVNGLVEQGTSAWGWKTGSNAYAAVPVGAANAASVVSGAKTSLPEGQSTGDKTNRTVVTFGVSANASQAPGTYTNSVVFTATVKDGGTND